MKNFTNLLDQNFTYGYDGEIYNLRSDASSQFNCYYRKAKYHPRSFREECVKNVKKIADYADSVDRTPMILYSGGMDSEVVIRAFQESGRRFKIIVNRFADNLNSHDMLYVKKFLDNHHLSAEFVDIDIKSWLTSNEAMTMAEKSKCAYSQMLPTMKLIDTVYFERQGIPVLGNGDFYASKIEGQWQYVEFEYILAWMRYCVDRNIIGSINFFQQTPEIVLAIAQDPLIWETVNADHEPNLRLAKYRVYQKYWPDIVVRNKFNGMERIKDYCESINEKYLKEYLTYTTKWCYDLKGFVNNLQPCNP